jgi:iron complex transport system ATP-binding protein
MNGISKIALRTAGLCVGYSLRRAQCPILSGLNLEVRAGEFVCLLGPNGAGKSTLLRTIAKLQAPLAGAIEVCGKDIRKLTQIELARLVGVVLTERAAAGALSGRRIVELGRYPHVGWTGRLSARDHEVVYWAMEVVGALHLAGRDSNKLSDGERQRLMIARAMAQEPVILILDEATAFLDIASRVELMGLLRSLAHDENLAVVISTHDLELALRMADTVWLVMPGGRFHSGVPEDVIIAGHIEAAFQAASIRFRPEERAFRPAAGSRGAAIVKGSGLGASLARAVLEREGYAIAETEPAKLTVTIERDTSLWSAAAGGEAHRGETFASLAGLARRL